MQMIMANRSQQDITKKLSGTAARTPSAVFVEIYTLSYHKSVGEWIADVPDQVNYTSFYRV